MPPKPAPLAPSELGTKEYWDALYVTELANHAHNPDDTGTVWFDDVDAESRMVAYLGELLEDEATNGRDVSTTGLRVVDLGCGNGSLLRAVRDELAERDLVSEETRLLGVDYSEASIALAQKVTRAAAEEKDADDTPLAIDLAVWDVLRGDAAALGQPAASWDVVLDKGTFDAISLGHTVADTDDTVESLYRRQVLRLLRPGGRFLVTSCNWTETELDAWMTAADEGAAGAGSLRKVGRVAYPSFQFGGQQGQAVCTVCYTKQSDREAAA